MNLTATKIYVTAIGSNLHQETIKGKRVNSHIGLIPNVITDSGNLGRIQSVTGILLRWIATCLFSF